MYMTGQGLCRIGRAETGASADYACRMPRGDREELHWKKGADDAKHNRADNAGTKPG